MAEYAEYIEKQAAIDALKALEKSAPTARHLSAIFDCEDTIIDLPAADVVPVVRCWKCKYATRWRSGESARKFGQVYECVRGVLTCPDPNDFCCRGDRKE